MKVGDLVLCTWQPAVIGTVNHTVIPMDMQIKGQTGSILDHQLHRYAIAFPTLGGYVHWLSKNAFEVINESR